MPAQSMRLIDLLQYWKAWVDWHSFGGDQDEARMNRRDDQAAANARHRPSQ